MELRTQNFITQLPEGGSGIGFSKGEVVMDSANRIVVIDSTRRWW